MEFLGLLCHLLIIGLSAALPLYTGGTYVRLGDTKYTLFQNLTLFCLGVWLAAGLWEALRRLVHGAGEGMPSGHKTARREKTGESFNKIPVVLSTVDLWVLGFGAAAVLSALFSRYGETAWRGYHEWYMGAVSQLLFVGIYFFVSRHYDGKQYSLWIGGAAFSAVLALGMCHRLGLDPSGLMSYFDTSSWEYSHMISTIGNINWFCGYCSVMLAFSAAAYLKGESRWKRRSAYVISIVCLTLLMVQGSDAGIVLAVVCLALCMTLGIGDGRILRGTVALGTGASFLLSFYGLAVRLLGDMAGEAVPPDGFGRAVLAWQGWWLLAAAGAGLYIGTARLLHSERGESVLRRIAVGAVVLIALSGLGGILFFALAGSFEGGWGNGRGALWQLALQGFWQGGTLQKLFGVGPDCFAEYIYSAFNSGELPSLGGRWAGTVFANAHNEWLNHLVNLGLAGTVCYAGIFAAALRRYRGYMPGLLAVILYGTVSLTGFQQVLSTPFLFLALGLAESHSRAKL